jgi:hypothetical protein
MEEQALPVTVTVKDSYAPPKAILVPLKVEERLLGCAKVLSGVQGSICVSIPQSS